jgi:glucose/arabinose dehydrogenase
MLSRAVKASTAAVAVTAVFGGAAQAAGPPPPTSTNGNPVEQVAAGLGTPTGFAFASDGTVFESDNGGMSSTGKPIAPRGGVYVLKNGTATLVPGSPMVSFGIVWHKGTLYVSTLTSILAWSGWDGTKFSKHRVVYKAPKKFTGFNGLGFGANGRLYAGVDTGPMGKFDHAPPHTPFAYDFLSFNPKVKGGDLKIVARGIRQPWQMAFPAGSSSPYVSDLGQDSGAKNPPDFVLRIKRGQNYGFPNCNWTKKKACKAFAKPFQLFTPHTDVMGLALSGGRLYMSEFLGNHGTSGLVQSIPASGGKPTTLLTGFVAPIVGMGINDGYLYVGELTGQIFRVKL